MYPFWRRFRFGCLFLASLAVTLCLGLVALPGMFAQAAGPAGLVQQGLNAYHRGDFPAAIEFWQSALGSEGINPSDQAVIQENLARAYRQIGRTADAIAQWESATATYRQLGNGSQVGRALTEQAQLYTALGQHRRAIALLCLPKAEQVTNCTNESAVSLARTTRDFAGEVAALGSLAEAYRLKGDYDQAQMAAQAGLTLAQQQGLSQYQAPLLSSLGNTYERLAQTSYRRAGSAESLGIPEFASNLKRQGQQQEAQALTYLQQGLQLAQQQNDPAAELRSHLNLLPLYQQNRSAEIETSRQRLGQLLGQLPASRETAYAAITLAQSYQPDQTVLACVDAMNQGQAQAWLERAHAIATQIADARAASFAQGELGHLYECQGNWRGAFNLTEQALWSADQALASADSAYLWQWQLGRIYNAQGKQADAIATYQKAIATLETIRTNLLTATQDLQFDFRDAVEPLYREFIVLQLEGTSAVAMAKQTSFKPAPVTPTALNAALTTADSLKLAELQNYFGNDCVLAPVSQVRVDLADRNSATTVISSIILPDRTAVIARFPSGNQQLSWVESSQQLQETVVDFRLKLQSYRDPTFDSTSSEQLYAWLIKPFETALQQSGTQTLVFVPDGVLRSVPMSALYDGNQYLVERYAVATTPSLTLTDLRPLESKGLQALALGLSQSVTTSDGQSFIPLSNVPNEIKTVLSKFPGSEALLNQEFSRDRLQQTLAQRSFPLLHVATHGQFGADPKDTFIVTGKGEKLTFGELEALIRQTAPQAGPIELISLTACETAVGDDRSTLGLAGVAIRAGARSAIASLWTIDDTTTAELINDFYNGLLQPGLNKAQALQTAQKAIISEGGDQAHPAYWAPLIMVGNWL